MTQHFALIDTAKPGVLKRVASEYVVGGYANFDFTVSTTTKSDFVIDGGTVTSGGKIDVFVNGIQISEGTGKYQWQRNTGANKIVTNTAQPKYAEVRVRLYS